jgi:hypothetical protein
LDYHINGLAEGGKRYQMNKNLEGLLQEVIDKERAKERQLIIEMLEAEAHYFMLREGQMKKEDNKLAKDFCIKKNTMYNMIYKIKEMSN